MQLLLTFLCIKYNIYVKQQHGCCKKIFISCNELLELGMLNFLCREMQRCKSLMLYSTDLK